MAVERADVERNGESALPAGHAAERDGERDLGLPPHSLQAEEAVLGSVLKNPASIIQVADFLRAEDFYSPRNRHIFKAMLAINADGRPIDYHTLADELRQLELYEASGGLIYLSELNLATPTAAHIEHYAHIVERTSIMRQLIAKAQTIAELAYRDNLDPDTALEKAEQLILSVAEKRVTRDFRLLEDVLAEYLEQVEALSEGEATRYGIPTGYIDLDKLLGGFQRTDLIILAARTSVGKALALDTPIPTLSGWTTMGDLRVGDQIFDEQGRPCTVTFATPVQHDRECYEVVFSDGERIVADADHPWSVLTRAARRSVRPEPTVLTTRQMAAALRTSSGHLNFSVPLAGALRYPVSELPIDPYVLGIWLAEGHATSPTVTLGDLELVDHLVTAGCQVRPRQVRGTPQFAIGPWIGRGQRVPGNAKLNHAVALQIRDRLQAGELGTLLAREYGVSPAAISMIGTSTTWRRPPVEGGMYEALSALGLIGNKRIPSRYQHASVEHRKALLQGLMDGDGSISELGYAEFCSTNRALAEGVLELTTSLGLAPRLKADRARLNGVDCGPRYRVRFLPIDFAVFRLSRKNARQRLVRARARGRQRFITAIRPVASVPVRCIQVDSPNHLYLAGRSCVATHNTSFALNLAVNAAVKHNATVAIFSLEMSAEQLASRLLSMESGIESPRIRSGHLGEQESRKLDSAVTFLAKAPIWVDDTPSIPIMELRSKARRLAAEHGIDMIVVDYLQLIASDGAESRVQELGQVTRALKALARELRVPVLALSQLSRAVEQRSPHIPQLSDLRESGCLTGDTLVALTSGELAPIASLVGQRPELVTLDGWRLGRARANRVWLTGHRPVFKLTTRTGRQIRATSNHPFRVLEGWRPLADLRLGDRIAIPRRYLPAEAPDCWPDERVVLLAHLIGDGCYAPRQPLHYTSASSANLRAVEQAALAAFGVVGRRVAQGTWHHLYLSAAASKWHPNPITEWLRQLGVAGQRSGSKVVPAEVFRLSNGQLALFLRHLWATDGCTFVRRGARGPVGTIYYATTSPTLAIQVQYLLNRFEIRSRIGRAHKAGYADGFHVVVSGKDDQVRFAEHIGVFGERGEGLRAIVAKLAPLAMTTNVDTVPVQVWQHVRARMRELGVSGRQMALRRGTSYGGDSHFRFAPSRSTLAGYAEDLDSQALREIASSDIYWDEVRSIEPDGEEDVYDICVPGTHNFVANGIVVHNSIEQDADVVTFIYRDEKYNPDTDKRGVADIIVAKHRNGPTGQVQLLFLERTTKFLDLEVFRA